VSARSRGIALVRLYCDVSGCEGGTNGTYHLSMTTIVITILWMSEHGNEWISLGYRCNKEVN